MNEPDLISRQRGLLRDLLASAKARGRDEPATVTALRSRLAEAERSYAAAIAANDRGLTDEQLDADSEHEAARVAAERICEEEQEEARAEAEHARGIANQRYTDGKEKAEAIYKEACWATGAVLEGAKGDAKSQLTTHKTRLTEQIEALYVLRTDARALLEEWNQPVEDLEAEANQEAAIAAASAPRDLDLMHGEAEQLLAGLRRLRAPRMLKLPRFLLLVGIVWAALVVPLGWLVTYFANRPANLVGMVMLGIAASAIVTALFGVVARAILAAKARTGVRDRFLPFCRLIAEAESAREAFLDRYKSEYQDTVRAAKQRHNQEVLQAHGKYQDKKSSLKRQLETVLPPVEERLRQRLTAAARRRESELGAAQERHATRRAEAQRHHDEQADRLRDEHRRTLDEIRTSHARTWDALSAAWRDAMTRLRREVDAIDAENDHLFPAWDAPSMQDWQPPSEVPPVLRFGTIEVRLDEVPDGVPQDEALKALTPPRFDLPALCTFPEQSPLLLQSGGEGHDQAVAALQNAVLRLLTSLPAGKARMVIIDPIGLGQNFAAFMHLADYDEKLVASRIWTESSHIELRLADLTAHMENVIQKYLRNEFATISDYNAHAGEVAEPYRILVVADFPVNFTADAIRRLLSVAQSGPRCGVFTLVMADVRHPLPKGFDLTDLERSGCSLVYKDGRFVWKDEDFGRYPLVLDTPPGPEIANRLLEKVGEAARDAQRVEVPFEYIAPTPEQYWTNDSRGGIRVALGRAGATARQFLELGKGTSQHALVAGKTGSGKSTLLHALITNLSLMYSPDEVELYLIDFKKGVEFKTYAAHALPHARVIAIESEREFGLSVLQRLDAELKSRGERFREVEAQDLRAYRQAWPDAYAPRILLVVDEFQEFFTEDDRISQEAAQLLDRLVRQGRAFGMHLLMGSQTLGGAYSLARSTIDQMAVRIALQCSEADANLILSDDNSAARLLSRPGEAIYNDANGLVEGNHPFQVVWLADERRENFLERIHEMAQKRRLRSPGAPVVFEGNAPADVTRNHRLRQLLEAPGSYEPDPRRGTLAWLGDALAINDQTAAPFRKQNGSNLMIVGQQEESALGMLTTAVISLSAQVPAGAEPPRFYVIDGRQAEPPSDAPLARLPEVVPHPLRLGGWRDANAMVGEVSAELARRQASPDTPAPPVYLVLFCLQRLRDLRRDEDDFGFGKKDGPASPAQQLATILREGPGLGIHVLFWCDNMNNLQRTLDRQAMREIGLRIVFQMGVADSSNLIDTPAASKLGLHRALFFSEEDGRLEKFRPYGIPPEAWLDEARDRLAAAAPAPAGS